MHYFEKPNAGLFGLVQTVRDFPHTPKSSQISCSIRSEPDNYRGKGSIVNFSRTLERAGYVYEKSGNVFWACVTSGSGLPKMTAAC